MKRYVKTINGKEVFTTVRGRIELDGCQVFNPTVEQILAAGYEEYVPPVHEPTEAETLAAEQAQCLAVMASSDAHAAKCTKLGLVFREEYPREYEAYAKARERYNEIEELIAALLPEDSSVPACLLRGTMITLADRSRKPVEEISPEDVLLVWDFDKGEFAEARPLWIMAPRRTNHFMLVTLSDGTRLRLVGNSGKCHRLFCVEDGAFTYAADMVGKHTVREDGSAVEVLSCRKISGNVVLEYYNVITDYHMNLYAEGVLTSCRYSNVYLIENMRYVRDAERPPVREETFSGHAAARFHAGLRLSEQLIPVADTMAYCDDLARMELKEKEQGKEE